MVVHRGTMLTNALKLHVVFMPDSGRFEIMEGETLAASGQMTVNTRGTSDSKENFVMKTRNLVQF